jgi:hypothetical protein
VLVDDEEEEEGCLIRCLSIVLKGFVVVVVVVVVVILIVCQHFDEARGVMSFIVQGFLIHTTWLKSRQTCTLPLLFEINH